MNQDLHEIKCKNCAKINDLEREIFVLSAASTEFAAQTSSLGEKLDRVLKSQNDQDKLLGEIKTQVCYTNGRTRVLEDWRHVHEADQRKEMADELTKVYTRIRDDEKSVEDKLNQFERNQAATTMRIYLAIVVISSATGTGVSKIISLLFGG